MREGLTPSHGKLSNLPKGGGGVIGKLSRGPVRLKLSGDKLSGGGGGSTIDSYSLRWETCFLPLSFYFFSETRQ